MRETQRKEERNDGWFQMPVVAGAEPQQEPEAGNLIQVFYVGASI